MRRLTSGIGKNLGFNRFFSESVERFKIVEVGPRDGLQNEKTVVPAATKVELIDRLSDCGLQTVEVTSFVSPKWVPQMADNNEVLNGIKQKPGVSYPVLVPNMAGLKAALANPNVKEIAVFGAASESFTRKNTNCSMEESFKRLKEVAEEGIRHGLAVRGYISMVVGDPDEGAIDPKIVAKISEQLFSFGCYEVSLGDTIGVGSVRSTGKMLDEVLRVAPAGKFAVHCHDTYGQALSNVLVAIEKGIRVADASISGLGGCPYAKGATGNLATEDLLYMLNDLGLDTGVDLDRLIETGQWICKEMGRENASRAGRALLTRKERQSKRG